MILLKIAWRNLLRNYRRSLITVSAMVVGVTALLFMAALQEGTNSQMIRNATALYYGHLQVHAKGFYDDPVLSKRIRDPYPLEEELKSTPGVVAVLPRVEGQGLLSTGEGGIGTRVVGIDPERERQFVSLPKKVISGRFLEPGETKKILLGKEAAEKLKVTVGQKVVLLSQGADGSIAADGFELAGIYESYASDLDAYTAIISIQDAREFFVIGPSVTGFTVLLRGWQETPEVRKRLAFLEQQGLEIISWQKLLPILETEYESDKAAFNFLLLIVFGIVGFGIMNTLTMSVLERVREFGMMMALGTTRDQLFRLVVLEAFLLAGGGILAGSVLGFWINSYFSVKGIPLAGLQEALKTMPGLEATMYARMKPEQFLIVGGWVMAITLLISLYPAFRAAGLQPVEAIRGMGRAGWRVRYLGIAEKGFSKLLPAGAIFTQMGWRNLMRNGLRSLLTFLAIGVCMALVLFYSGLMKGFIGQTAENATRYLIGHLQIAGEGFYREPSSLKVVKNLEQAEKYLGSDPGVAAYTPRIEQEALLSSAENAYNIVLMGIDPKKEDSISRFSQVVRDGRYLKADDTNAILLGSLLAEKLKVGLGDKVVIMAQGTDGNFGSEAYRVQGILHTGIEGFDLTLAMVSLKSAQSLLGMEGVSKVVVRLKDKRELLAVRDGLSTALAGSGNEVKTWRDLYPALVEYEALVGSISWIFLSVFYAIVLLVVMNTMVMGVMERTREFGLMMALGTTRLQVVKLVLLETFFLGLWGVILGNLAGIWLVEQGRIHGVDFSKLAPEGASFNYMPGMEPVIYLQHDWGMVVMGTVTLFLFLFLFALYPAWKAASLDPAKAIRHA